MVQSATAEELADIYRALARRERRFDPAVPAAVFVGVPIAAPAAERLGHFGVDVHELAESDLDTSVRCGAYLLGGTAHGTRIPVEGPAEVSGDPAGIPGGTDGSGPVSAVVALVERVRLREWAARVGPEPRLTTLHTPGSDSRGVVQFGLGGTQVVAKIGAAEAIAAEAGFASRVNTLLAGEGRPGLFPRVYALAVEGGQGVSLMEAGAPMPIDPLFADRARTTLDGSAPDRLQPHLDALAAWYRLTAGTRRPTVADYLYRERYHVLREHPAFLATFRALVGDLAPADVLDARVDLPGGMVPGYGEAVAWLDEVAAGLLPDRGSAVHGDIYAANMLVRADGSPVLIDPRTVWEGRDRPDVGYGDPVYDLATLLHGVLPMAAILRAVQVGTTAELFDHPSGGQRFSDRVVAERGRLDLSSLRLPVHFPLAVRALEARMLQTVPGDEPPGHARTRLYVGAATSLAGWLKYERSLRTPQAWFATFAYVIWYLWQARSVWEECRSRKQDS